MRTAGAHSAKAKPEDPSAAGGACGRALHVHSDPDQVRAALGHAEGRLVPEFLHPAVGAAEADEAHDGGIEGDVGPYHVDRVGTEVLRVERDPEIAAVCVTSRLERIAARRR